MSFDPANKLAELMAKEVTLEADLRAAVAANNQQREHDIHQRIIANQQVQAAFGARVKTPDDIRFSYEWWQKSFVYIVPSALFGAASFLVTHNRTKAAGAFIASSAAMNAACTLRRDWRTPGW